MTDHPNQFIVFKLDGQKFSLRLTSVDRIERAVEITPLPTMPENVLGIVNLKGQIVPVFNIRRRFRLRERDIDPRDRLIFAHTARRTVALVVDAVSEIIGRQDRDVIAAGEILPGLDSVEGAAKVDDGLVLIHDLDRFLSLQEEATLDEAMRLHD
jgi:purine-binding chemotaxis protein CheW